MRNAFSFGLAGVLTVVFSSFCALAAAEPVDSDSFREISWASATRPESPRDPYVPGPMPEPTLEPPRPVESRVVYGRGGFDSIQVNVNLSGRNIFGDAANEPSIAVDPIDPNRIIIGWRQFDSVTSDFRQAGRGYSQDAGRSWVFPGVLQRGTFGSDPVVGADTSGNFYYLSLQPERDPNRPWGCYLYKSMNGGVTFMPSVYAYGGDKEWMVIDHTFGIGNGNIYIVWTPYFPYACCGNRVFTRSIDGGLTFSPPVTVPREPFAGTMAVAADGSLYITGITNLPNGMVPVIRSANARNPDATPTFNFSTNVYIGGSSVLGNGPNPAGLLGQMNIATDNSFGPNGGNIYLCGSVRPLGGSDPLDVMFVRSSDGGLTWSAPHRINDDNFGNGAWQWFATMSVAPNGRIDVIWNDTRDDSSATNSILYYSFSQTGGRTWSPNLPISREFNHFLGYPNQSKLGDYYGMISDDVGAHLAYAATFNGEQDIYYLRITRLLDRCTLDADSALRGFDCNGNGVADDCDISEGTSDDVDENTIPDECESDFDGDGELDATDPDVDNDGVLNDPDICDFTPLGTPVHANGRPFGDVDRDCFTDLRDYAAFGLCLPNAGPGALADGLLSFCLPNFDSDGDQDIDLKDIAQFQRGFTSFTR